MGRFVQLDPNAFPAAALRIYEAVLGADIPWEHRNYGGRRTSYDHDQMGVLGYLLAPGSHPRIDGNWLSLIGATVVPEWTNFPVYRFELPVSSGIQQELFSDTQLRSYFELSPRLEGGWLGAIRTFAEDTTQSEAQSGVGLISNRIFATRADVVLFLWMLGGWPIPRVGVDSGDSSAGEGESSA